MPKRSPLCLLFIPLLLAPACSREPSRDLPATLAWHKDQNLISAAGGSMNAWEGVRVKADHFVADGEIAQFILWRRQKARTAVFIEYSLRGPKAELAVNGGEKRTLRPSPSFRWEKFEFHLLPGMNFLRFRKKGREELRIRAIAVGRRTAKPEPHLQRGESFSVFLPAGSGRIELHGSGRVRIDEQAMAAAALPPRTRELRSGLFSRKIAVAIDLSRPALVRVTSLRGRFVLGAYSFREQAEPAAASLPRFRGKPDVFIILSDACRPDRLGAYGYSRNTSPNIDAFAAAAMVYENAYANATFTRSSVATLLTGLYPDSHKVRILQHELPGRFLTLPEYLNVKGYRTSIFSSSLIVSPPSGFNQGVEEFDNFRVLRYRDDIASIRNGLAGWLEKTAGPRFSYLHYLQPHLPTVPPAGFQLPFAGGEKAPDFKRMIALANKAKDARLPFSDDELRELNLGYDASIAWMDAEFGKVMDLLKRKNLYEDSLIIFLADHGEVLKEHGAIAHGSNVYDESARVPLIVKYPGSLGLRGRSRPVCELVDVFPTISGLFGQDIRLDGRSLLARGRTDAYDDRMAVSSSFAQVGLYGLRWHDWHYIISLKDGHEELFQLGADPLREVSRRYPQVAAYFHGRFLDWYGRFRDRKGSAAELNLKKLPASEIEDMKTLGYL